MNDPHYVAKTLAWLHLKYVLLHLYLELKLCDCSSDLLFKTAAMEYLIEWNWFQLFQLVVQPIVLNLRCQRYHWFHQQHSFRFIYFYLLSDQDTCSANLEGLSFFNMKSDFEFI